MARSKQDTPKRETVRDDPPDTVLDPSQAMYILMQPDGSALERGKLTDRFHYSWVNKSIQTQFLRFQARGFRPVRAAPTEVRPRFDMYTLDEEREEGDGEAMSNAIIERNEMVLMKRPRAMMDAEYAASRAIQEARQIKMGKLDPKAAKWSREYAAVEVDREHSIHKLG